MSPQAQALVTALSTLSTHQYKAQVPAVTSLGLLRTLKGRWPWDKQQEAGLAVMAVSQVCHPLSHRHGSRKTAPQNPWRKDITWVHPRPAACLSLGCPSSHRVCTQGCGLEGGSVGWMTGGHQWGHSALAHLHVGALGAGKHRAHVASPGTAAPARAHPPAGGRENSLPAKPRCFLCLGCHHSPCQLLAILHPQTALQSLLGLCHGQDGPSWEEGVCRVSSALPAGPELWATLQGIPCKTLLPLTAGQGKEWRIYKGPSSMVCR